MIAAAKTMGELHRWTRNRHPEWIEWRGRFGPPPRPGSLFREPWPDARTSLSDSDVEAAARAYAEVCRSVSVSPEPGFEGEIAQVARVIEHDVGPFGCLAAGDQNVPSQFILRQGQAWAVDFDASGFRHALIDGASIRVLWASVERIPELVVQTLERTYQEAFAPESEMDFEGHYHLATARWHILHVVHRLPWALEGDFLRSARTTLRQQMLVWLETFGDGNSPKTPALRQASAELHHRLKGHWSDVSPAPFYRAYGG